MTGAVLLLAFAFQCPDGAPPPCSATRAPRAASPNSVAVLYFDNLSRDTAFAYLADGVTEELITSLRRVGRLSVPSRNESARLRQGPAQAPSATARQLGVRYLLSGSVQPTAGRLRVNAELLDATTGRVVWGDRLIVSGNDPMAAQDSIAAAVVAAVSGALNPEDRRALASRRPTRDSVAYDLYLRGRVAFARGGTREAIGLFERALERDSLFANAAAGGAVAWGWMDDEVTPMVAQTEARLLAERALRLDSTLALAWTALAGAAFQGDRDYDLAGTLARRAVALDPSLPDPHGVLAGLALLHGRPREFAAEIAREWQLDSLSDATLNDRFHFFDTARDTAQLAQLVSYSLRRGTLVFRPYSIALAIMQGRCDEAVALTEHGPANGRPWRAMALACAGRTAESLVLLDSLTPELRFTEPLTLARITMALGDRDRALAWLAAAVVARQYYAVFLDVDWRWAPLHGDPRFETLRRRLGLVH